MGTAVRRAVAKVPAIARDATIWLDMQSCVKNGLEHAFPARSLNVIATTVGASEVIGPRKDKPHKTPHEGRGK